MNKATFIPKQLILNTFLLLTGFTVSAQTITFANNSLKTKLLQSNTTNGLARDINGNSIKIDANNDQQIQVSEAEAVYRLTVSGGSIINNPGGIEYFTNLTHLTLTDIYLKSLNVISMANLKELDCHNNTMTTLTLGNHTQLEKLNCGNNEITALNTTGLPGLKYLDCNDNKVTALNLSQNSQLTEVRCNFNLLASLNIQSLALLQILYCDNNKLPALEMSGLTGLIEFGAQQNLFSTLNANDCSQLNYFNVDHNPNLTSLYLKNGGPEENFSFNQTPNLQYICCDADEIDLYQYRLSFTTYNCMVDSACALSTEKEVSAEVKIYPNPVKDVLAFSGFNADNITIYDVMGKIVMTQHIKTGNSQIDLSEMAQGCYIVLFNTQEGPLYHRIIKE